MAFSSACQSGKGMTAYVGATLFDGSGAPPVQDAVVVIAGGRIEAVGPPDLVKVPRGATEVRLDGKWIIPGLIDAHTAVTRWALSRFVAYGVTSARDLEGPRDTVFALRDEMASGGTPGPRLYVAGWIIDGRPSGRPGTVEVGTANEARRAIDQLVLREAAQTMIFPKIDARLLKPLMDEASTLKLPVAARLGKVDALSAARMGVASLEHMSGVVEAGVAAPRLFFDAHDDFYRGWNTFERGWAVLDSATVDRVARELAKTGVAIVPTLGVHETYSRLDDPSLEASLDLSGVPESVRAGWNAADFQRRAGLGPRDFEAFRRSRSVQDRFVRRFTAAGGLLAAGSNAVSEFLPPGASLHNELALLVRAGLTPRQALLAATRDGARLMAADSIGVIRKGVPADFLVLSASPLDDIANTRKIELVVVGGNGYRPDELRSTW